MNDINPTHRAIRIDKLTLAANCTYCGLLVTTEGLPGTLTDAGRADCPAADQ